MVLPTADAGGPAAVGRFRTFRALQQHRDFRLLWIGSVASNTGTWMQMVAQGWLVLQLSGSPLYLGLVGLARALPTLVFSLFGGAVSDFIDRRKLMYITQAVMALDALVLAVLTHLGLVEVWHVLALTLVHATAMAFDQPARQALVPQLVSKENLFNAYALNATAFQAAALLGPMLAGGLVPLIGLAGCFYANVISYGAIIAALALMTFPAGPAAVRSHSLGRDLLAGIAEVRQQPTILGLLLMMALASFFGRGYSAFLPVFADLLQVGVTGLGALTAASGLGTVVASLAVASLRPLLRPGRMVVLVAVGFAGCLALYAWSPSFWLTFAALVLVGALNTVMRTLSNTTIQWLTPDSVRGRVMSLFGLATMAAMPFGQAPMGWWMEQVGPRWAVTTGALLVAIGVVALTGRYRPVWQTRLDLADLDDPTTPAAPALAAPALADRAPADRAPAERSTIG